MTRFLLALAFALSLSLTANAQNKAIEDVISRQIEAFEADDFATAFGFASTIIQNHFGTPERFGTMVRNGFPMVWRPADIQYLGQDTQTPFTYQRVRVRDQEGAFFTLEYQMIATPDGWRINGVQFIEDPALSA